ncbi:MAG: 1-(5-phosphoribosyl)-5-[(5-phosphoribosylamino)methylideneamino]imidazole-4-carboxamide isomerase [Alphaproteobacteria bacterium]|nr:1-(5-phosphoribosyl)-5-[(5-phosphoribosylamino)methylideneamino]imidazole-4-carboxamide isomerase [Alphaproteobacteria bacterium]
MILFPAIDLKQGTCVRLKQGEMTSATVFNTDPAAQARIFERDGFRWLHCVDLDGAFSGRAANTAAIEKIRGATSLRIQLGGGIRNLGQIQGWLDSGIERVVLGTVALTDPGLVREAARLYPNRIVVSADARDGKIATEGWARRSSVTPLELAQRFEDAGVAAVLFTDIDGDGLLGGINLDATLALARSIRIPVIASGGVANIGDIKALLAAHEERIEGVVIGRALYDGSIDAREAVGLATGADPARPPA